jgi:hypothetical protein
VVREFYVFFNEASLDGYGASKYFKVPAKLADNLPAWFLEWD